MALIGACQREFEPLRFLQTVALGIMAMVVTGSTHWEIAEPQTEAGASPVDGGSLLVWQPPALFPTVPPKSPGSDPPYPIFLPTHVDHDGALASAAATRVRQLGGSFTEPEMTALLRVTGWPESLIPEALSQSWCESRHSPYAWNGVDAGLFGMSMSEAATMRGSWFEYWGLDPELRFDPYANATAGRLTYEYAAARYGDGWGPWSCKP